MTPAALVISKFGSVHATASALGLYDSTVWRWNKPRNEGGHDGKVPQKYFKTILNQFPEVTLDELVFGS